MAESFKVALVTGATSGIGLGVASRLAAAGVYHLAIHGSRSKEDAASAISEVEKARKHGHQRVRDLLASSPSPSPSPPPSPRRLI